MGSPHVPRRTENNKHVFFSRGQKDKRLNKGLTEPPCPKHAMPIVNFKSSSLSSSRERICIYIHANKQCSSSLSKSTISRWPLLAALHSAHLDIVFLPCHVPAAGPVWQPPCPAVGPSAPRFPAQGHSSSSPHCPTDCEDG